MLTAQRLSDDRLGFGLFLAVVIHGILILGVSFSPELTRVPERVLDVTIALTPSQAQPEKIDYLSDVHQIADEIDNGPLKSLPSISSTAQTPESQSANSQTSREGTPSQKPQPLLEPAVPLPLQTDLNQFRRPQQNLEIDTRFFGERIQRLSRVNAAASPEAFYLRSWQRKVETIGNLNYPEAARRAGIYGKLRLLVAVRSDGSLKEILVLESSGESLLDQAAINIVSLAEPFPPFSEALRQTTDVLEIVRTWQFRKNMRTVGFTP